MGLSLKEKEAIIFENDSDPQRILNIFLDIQFASEEGYIDEETAKLVGSHLGLSEARVYELLSFYAILKTEPQAKYVLKICNSTPCLYTGGDMLAEVLETILEVPIDQATPDGLFMYHSIPCIGACDQGPVIKIKDTVFSDLTEEKVYQLIDDLRNGCYLEL
ncbi:NAD(P)H-dependent oxidoreductase subunit E [Enterococcus sp. DIV0242_7C1]|uniref:NADH-quinone oxidoreductase subunit E n=1 Tax=Candidatus Enterococcus dunnyi TaxID=1834192 RepID=A0A200JDP9_9ENTE|nr:MULTISPECIES: NAD(P)H-dependent oxidoreductase subunit E [unclassified Enterococcus]MBO0469740.1 NAD(P)H-dependent oxidoreductase subunit E [Enterococcus sp. DIV0242_7C1]OUZ34971.1 NADH-quinone oxidoreductase subunit E [Enterococcus sp. 9D6_DIV0238]